MGNQPTGERTRVTTVVEQVSETPDVDVEAMRRIPKFVPVDPNSLKKTPVSFSTLHKPERVRTDALAGKEESIASPLVSICAQYREFCRRWNEPTMHSQAVLMTQMHTLDHTSQDAVRAVQAMKADLRRIEAVTEGEVAPVQNAAKDLERQLTLLVAKVDQLNKLLPSEHRMVSFQDFQERQKGTKPIRRGK
eukprot:TRINITY_DN3199_c0_g1_i1.p1 TRINITY_DN3199_c0_g1~~TRINITY_DN3199_c0_g1_i1.p1  ORF type:complete len:192 (-),score=31.86 TRINITY_DN3199_c0_g1_i1:374-949(-)